MKRILSSLLVFVMLCASLLTVIPISAAADEGSSKELSIQQEGIIEDADEIKKICQEYLAYNFKSASEMLDYELEKGYLDYIKEGDFAIYVNRYTGFMYYVNNRTGQILTSNPTDPAYQTKDGGNVVSLSNEIMGQLIIEYFSLTDTKPYTYDSLRWIMDGSLLSVTEHDGGIAVQYTLGSAADSFIAPSVMLLETANRELIHPMFKNFADLMQELCGDFDPDLAKDARISSIKSNNYNLLDNDIYRAGSTEVYSGYKVNPLLDDYAKYALKYFGNNKNDPNYKRVTAFVSAIQSIFNNYDIITASAAPETLKEKVSALNDGKTIILIKGADTGDTTLAAEVYDKMTRVMNVFVENMANGLLLTFTGKNNWNFYDWTADLQGRLGKDDPATNDMTLNVLGILALDAFKEICTAIDRPFPYEGLADSMRAECKKKFFNHEKSLFSMYDVNEREIYNVMTNSLAILADIVDGETAKKVCENMLSGELIDCTLSLKMYKYNAMLKADEEKYRDAVLDEIRREYTYMLDAGATAAWETIDGEKAFHNAGSLCHGWSAVPIHFYHRFGMVK